MYLVTAQNAGIHKFSTKAEDGNVAASLPDELQNSHVASVVVGAAVTFVQMHSNTIPFSLHELNLLIKLLFHKNNHAQVYLAPFWQSIGIIPRGPSGTGSIPLLQMTKQT